MWWIRDPSDKIELARTMLNTARWDGPWTNEMDTGMFRLRIKRRVKL